MHLYVSDYSLAKVEKNTISKALINVKKSMKPNIMRCRRCALPFLYKAAVMMSCDMKRIPNEKSPSRMPMSVIIIEVENCVGLQIYKKSFNWRKFLWA